MTTKAKANRRVARRYLATNLKPFYGNNLHYELQKYTRERGGLPQYGVSYSAFPKWGINPKAQWAPYGVWFYFLSPHCTSGIERGFATDRSWANVAKLNHDRLLIVKKGHPDHFDDKKLHTALALLDATYGPAKKQVRPATSAANTLINAIDERVGMGVKFNRMFHDLGYDGILDFDAAALPIERCQGVITWVRGGAKYVASFPTEDHTSPQERLGNMLTNLGTQKPGSLKLNRDDIHQIIQMGPDFYHKWDISDSLADLYGSLMRALDFTHADSWEWGEGLVDDYGGERFYMDLEPNPTTPRTVWENLQYSSDMGANLTAKDMLKGNP